MLGQSVSHSISELEGATLNKEEEEEEEMDQKLEIGANKEEEARNVN